MGVTDGVVVAVVTVAVAAVVYSMQYSPIVLHVDLPQIKMPDNIEKREHVSKSHLSERRANTNNGVTTKTTITRTNKQWAKRNFFQQVIDGWKKGRKEGRVRDPSFSPPKTEMSGVVNLCSTRGDEARKGLYSLSLSLSLSFHALIRFSKGSNEEEIRFVF